MIKKIYFPFLLCLVGTYAAEQNQEQDQNKLPLTNNITPANDWTTIWSKINGSTLPPHGDSLAGIGMNRAYTLEQLNSAPFVKYLDEKLLLTQDELVRLFNEKSEDKNNEGVRRMHGLVLYGYKGSFQHLAEFNAQRLAEINADAMVAVEAANLENRRGVIEAEREKYDRMIDAFGKGERLLRVGALRIFALLGLLFVWGVFVYGFLRPVFAVLAPSKKPKIVADTNIVVPFQRLKNVLGFPFYLIYRMSGRYFFRSFFSEKEKRDIPKAYYPVKIKELLDDYQLMVSVWSQGANSTIPNLLLEGIPGVGKTLFVKNLFKDKGISFIQTNSKLLRQLVSDRDSGAVEREIIALFEMAQSSYRRNKKKVIIFIDEADKLGPQIETLLGLMDEADATRVAVILSCNNASLLPEPVRSRMGQHIYVLPPTKKEIESIMTDAIAHADKVYGPVRFFKKTRKVKELLGNLHEALEARKVVGREITSRINRIASKKNAKYLTSKSGKPASKVAAAQVTLKDLFKEFGVEINSVERKIKAIDAQIKSIEQRIKTANRSEKKNLKQKIKELKKQQKNLLTMNQK